MPLFIIWFFKLEEEPLILEPTLLVEESVIEEELVPEEEESELHSVFTNVSCAFEPTPAKPLCYFLSWDIMHSMLKEWIPEFKTITCSNGKPLCENLEELYEKLKSQEYNNEVLSHEYLNHRTFNRALKYLWKFSVRFPSKIVKEIVNQLKM